MSSPALDIIRVPDFTQLLQGLYVTQMLGDMGADVIKIERYRTGDLYRTMTFFNKYRAFLRPRYPGDVPFQEAGGHFVREFLAGDSSAADALDRLNQVYLRS